jgi:hypothetical protein
MGLVIFILFCTSRLVYQNLELGIYKILFYNKGVIKYLYVYLSLNKCIQLTKISVCRGSPAEASKHQKQEIK